MEIGTEFTGTVEAISDDAWTIVGQTVTIAPGTSIVDTIDVGTMVKVNVWIDADQSLTAYQIEAIRRSTPR